MLPLSRGSIDTGAIPSAWLHKTSSQWTRLQPHDEDALQSVGSEQRSAVVPIEGGRAEVHLSPAAGTMLPRSKGRLEQRYRDIPPAPLVESLWCFKPPGGQWMPFAIDDDVALELQLQQLLREAMAETAASPSKLPLEPPPDYVTSDGQYTLRLVLEGGRSTGGLQDSPLKVYAEMKTVAASGWVAPLGAPHSGGKPGRWLAK